MKPRRYNGPWPDEAVLKPIRDRLSDPNYKGGSQALPSNATEVDRAKYELCKLVVRYKRENQILQKDIAKKLGIDESRASDILRKKIKGFTLDRLVGYGEILYPGLKLKILAA